MSSIIADPVELRRRGFAVLVQALGWVNAVAAPCSVFANSAGIALCVSAASARRPLERVCAQWRTEER